MSEATSKPAAVEFLDGPCKGFRRVLRTTNSLWLLVDETGGEWHGVNEPKAIVTYELVVIAGKAAYRHANSSVDEKQVKLCANIAIERWVREAAANFYANLDPTIYTLQPTDDHLQQVVQVGARRAMVDEKIAPLVEAVWHLNLDTAGSCQCLRKGTSNEGMAYVDFNWAADADVVADIAKANGIGVHVSRKVGHLQRNGPEGQVVRLTHDSANLILAPEDIERLAWAIRKNIAKT